MTRNLSGCPLPTPEALVLLEMKGSSAEDKTETDGIRELVDFLALQGFGPQEPLSWPKLVVREALADTLRGKPTEAEQIDAIYSRLKHWSSLLFADGRLEKVLGKA